MIQRTRARTGPADQDHDPWGEKAYHAALAARPKNPVRDHLEALRTSTELTGWCRKERWPHLMQITPHEVIAALNGVGVTPVLMGTYGINGYRAEERATHDVDVLVPKRDVRKAVRALEERFPDLKVRENAAVVRFLDPETNKAVIDVMKPSSTAMRVVFRHTLAIKRTHRIPELEMALVCKFLAMTSENRDWDKRYLDAGDFVSMLQNNRDDIDRKKLARLANQVQPRGAARITEFIADVDAGRRISF